MTVSDGQHRLLEDLFDSIDRMDTGRFLHFLCEDATFRFGSAEAASGHSEIRAAVDAFFGSIAGLSHRVDRVLADDGVLVCEGDVTYTRHDESQITLPFVNVFEMAGDLIQDYKIYADPSSLYADA